MKAPVIDAVVTWVDGGNIEYQSLLESYTDDPLERKAERFRDLHEGLRYALRSIHRFAPWLRRIHLVTLRPQSPPWLDTGHERISLVHHDTLFDVQAAQPAFSCHVIETYLHRIPDLPDYYLYFNDDYFLGCETSPADFLTPDGRVRLRGTLWGEAWKGGVREARWNLFSKLQHEPIFFFKPWVEEMLDDWAEPVAAMRRRRFRNPGDIMVHALYRYHVLKAHRQDVEVLPFWRYYFSEYRFGKITNRPGRVRRLLDWIERRRPRFYCLNDDQGDHPDPEVCRLVGSFLRSYYPNPAPWEN